MNLRGSTFKHNAARFDGGAILIRFLRYDFQSSQFVGNFAGDGGGAISGTGSGGANGNISDCSFEDNIAESSGGAIDGLTATDVLDSNFRNNTSGRSCGAMCASVTTLRGCRFEENSARIGSGGAIRGDFQNVRECHFKGNKASEGRRFFGGGAIEGLVINLQDSIFENNEAGGGGGALHIRTRISTNVKGCLFSGNRAVDGGAIELYDITTMSMEDVEFKNNSASGAGGAINFFSSDRQGPSIVRTMHLVDCLFEGNAAEFGGGIYSYMHPRTFNPSQIHLEGCYFGANTATIFGGAIDTYNTETSIIGQSKFACNSAVAGGAIHHEDDDSYNYIPRFGEEPTPISIADAHFILNEAAFGGALLIESAPSSMDRCTWNHNNAWLSGGAILLSDVQNLSPANSTHNLTENAFQGNTAGFGTSDDIFIQGNDGGSTYNCGNGYDNCFCDANPADLPDISTIVPADTCPDAGTPPTCECVLPTPTICPIRNRVGAMTRTENDGLHDTEDLLKTLHEKQELMFEEMLLRLNSTNSSSPADGDDKRSEEEEEEELETFLEKYGMKAQP